MAVDYGYILSFDNSSGLPPQVVAKLNNNFFHLMNLFTDPDIVMATGATFPDPRTNETMFYNTETGQLYIWYYYRNFDPVVYQEPYWDWKPLDMGLIHVENKPPSQSSYVRQEEIIWYDLSNYNVYFYYKFPSTMGQGWCSIDEIITRWVEYNFSQAAFKTAVENAVSGISKNDWLASPGFVAAIDDIIANSSI